jgi:hypothetical protein
MIACEETTPRYLAIGRPSTLGLVVTIMRCSFPRVRRLSTPSFCHSRRRTLHRILTPYSVAMAGTGRRCKSCEARLPGLARPDRFYCSPACRQSAYERRRGPRPLGVVTPTEQTEIARVLAEATREERLLALVAHAARRARRGWSLVLA